MTDPDRNSARTFAEHLRNNPEQYKALRDQLRSAKTEADRVEILIDFATSDQQLKALAPAPAPGSETNLAWTTVTITTIFIPDSAY